METASEKVMNVVEGIFEDYLHLNPEPGFWDRLLNRTALRIYCQTGYSKTGNLLHGIFISSGSLGNEEQILCVNDEPLNTEKITRVLCKDPRYDFVADELAKAFGLEKFCKVDYKELPLLFWRQ